MSGSICDVYDTEVDKILELMTLLNDKARHRKLNYNDFEREIRDRFAAIGFTVDVNWYRFEAGGVEQDGAMPEVTVTGRVNKAFTFDPNQQVHEVTNNVLDLPGGGGVIKTDPETVKGLLSRGHKHG